MLRLLLVLAVLAAAVYTVFWLMDRRNKGVGGGRARTKPIAPGPVGPDDDEDFLRQLERRSRHAREREAKRRAEGGPATKPTSDGPQAGPVPPAAQQPPADTPPAPSAGEQEDPTTPGTGDVAGHPAVGGSLNGSPNGRPTDPRKRPPAQHDEESLPEDGPRDESRRGTTRRGSDAEDNATDDDA